MPHAWPAPPIARARSSAARSPTSSSPKATSSTAGPSISRSRLRPRAAAAADGAGEDSEIAEGMEPGSHGETESHGGAETCWLLFLLLEKENLRPSVIPV